MQARSHDVVGPAGELVSDQRVIAWLRQALKPQHWPISAAMAQPLKNDSPRTIRSRGPLAPESDDSPATIRDSVPAASSARQVKASPSAPPTSRDQFPDAGTTESRPMTSSPTAAGEESRALRVLEHLRVASLERLIREAAIMDTWVTRKLVLKELENFGSRVRWFGRSIVALVPEDPS